MARRPHVLVISQPFQGHVSPMMQFSKRLASKGLQVTFVCPSSTIVLSKSINMEYFAYDNDHDTVALKENMANIKKRVSDKVVQVIEKEKGRGQPIEVLVHDSLMPWAVGLGHENGLRVACFFPQPCAGTAIYYLLLQGKFKVPLEEGASLSFVPSAIPITKASDLPRDLLFETPGVSDLLASQFSHVHEADWILWNTFLHLEYEVVNWLSSIWKIMPVGPSVPSMYLDKRIADDSDYGLSLYKPEGEACIKWLDGKDADSVVYVSFGSVYKPQEDCMHEIAWGLLNSKFNFLWVVRDSEKSKLSEKFLEESADRGLIVNWCPQLEVLSHKAVGSFMTHCGWNSTLEAICLGVPVMVMPQWTEQTTNAMYIVDIWQTGVRVKAHDKESITREDVTKSVKDCMEGTKREELKANVLKFKEMASEAMSEGGSSDKNIDAFISDIVTPTTST